jgi:DNA-binding phage protein
MLKRSNYPGDFVNDFIKVARTELDNRGMSVSELARQSEVSRPYTSRVLNGEKNPTLEWVQRVAKTLGISVRFEKSC